MRYDAFIAQATRSLSDAGILTARLDSIVLLEDATGQDRSSLLAHPETVLPDTVVALLTKQIELRARHTPLAYIRGKAAFYGHVFRVSPAVLVPRPESEAIIGLLLDIPTIHSGTPIIADIGTGSGALGITAALALPHADVWLYDIDTEALAVAKDNAQKLHATVQYRTQDLLLHMTEQPDIILANLPYVPDAYPINDAAKHEPALALFAGSDGLDAYRIFWQQLATRAVRPSYVITEALTSQHHPLALIARSAGFTLERTNGLAQLFTA